MKKSKQIQGKINESIFQSKSEDCNMKISDINRINHIQKIKFPQKNQPKFIQQKNYNPLFRCNTTQTPSPKNKENENFSLEKKSYIIEKQKLDNNQNKKKIVENMISNILLNQYDDSQIMNDHQILVVNLKKISAELQISQKKNNDLIHENKILLQENQTMVDFISQQEKKITQIESKHKEELQNCMKKFQEIFFQYKEKNNQSNKKLSDMKQKVTEYQNNLVGPIFDIHEIELIVESFRDQNYKKDYWKQFVSNVHNKILKLIKKLNPFINDLDLELSLDQFGKQMKYELKEGYLQLESNVGESSIQVDDYQQQFYTNTDDINSDNKDKEDYYNNQSSPQQSPTQLNQSNNFNTEIDISQQTMIVHSKDVSQSFLGISNPIQMVSIQNSSINSLYVEEPVIMKKEFEKSEQTPQFNSEKLFFIKNITQGSNVLVDKTSCINNSTDVERRVRTEAEETSQKDEYVIGKIDFQGQNKNDLHFSKGDKIQVLKKSKNGWWIGLCRNKIGYFPSNYIESIIFS